MPLYLFKELHFTLVHEELMYCSLMAHKNMFPWFLNLHISWFSLLSIVVYTPVPTLVIDRPLYGMSLLSVSDQFAACRTCPTDRFVVLCVDPQQPLDGVSLNPANLHHTFLTCPTAQSFKEIIT